MKLLSKYFKVELADVYGQIDTFREGFKSLETYTDQAAIMAISQNKNDSKHQGVFGHKKETEQNAKAIAASLTLFHKMLYFLQLKEEMNGNINSLPNVLSEDEIQKVIFDENYIKFLRSKTNEDLSSLGQNTAMALKQKKVEAVQYECIKSELKDEYERKMSFLTKRLTK